MVDFRPDDATQDLHDRTRAAARSLMFQTADQTIPVLLAAMTDNGIPRNLAFYALGWEMIVGGISITSEAVAKDIGLTDDETKELGESILDKVNAIYDTVIRDAVITRKQRKGK